MTNSSISRKILKIQLSLVSFVLSVTTRLAMSLALIARKRKVSAIS
jgi:hypothetical protein